MNLFEAVRRIPEFFQLTPHTSKLVNQVQDYVMIIMFAGISVVYYLDMIYLTLDKCAEIWWNIKYPLYWDKRRTKQLLTGTWLMASCLVLVVALLHTYTAYDWKVHMFTYCFPALNFLFLVIASFSYGFIFYKYKQTHDSPLMKVTTHKSKIGANSNDENNNTTTTEAELIRENKLYLERNKRNNKSNIKARSTILVTRRQSSFEVFRKSKFMMIFLLIVTFIIFIVIPDLTLLFVEIVNGQESRDIMVVCWIMYAVGNLFDCYIYIFMQSSVKKLLIRKFKCRAI